MRTEQLLAIIHAYPGTPLAARVKAEYRRITEARDVPPVTLPESALFIAEQTIGDDPDETAGDELLRAFEEAVVREAYQTAVTELRRAEASADAPLVARTQRRCAELSARLAALGA